MTEKTHPGVVVTPAFTAHFPRLVDPSDLSQQYEIVAVFNQGGDLDKLKDAVRECARAKWGNKIPKNFKSPFRTDKDEYYGGNVWSSLRTKRRPQICARDESAMPAEEIYGGCVCRAVVQPWAYDTAGNAGVRLTLCLVHFLAHGTLAGGASADVRGALSDEPIPDVSEVDNAGELDL